jgi:hypothetical protein
MAGTGKIFISYRREDSATITGRVYDWLTARVPKEDVFFDVDLEYGVDFVQRIQSTIAQCKAMLVIIGPHWLDADDAPSTYVRMEVEAALHQGVRVIPILVGGAMMPAAEKLPPEVRQLAFLNAAGVRDGRDFAHDMEDLAKDLAKTLGPPLAARLTAPRSRNVRRNAWITAGTALVLLALGVAGLLKVYAEPTTDPYATATLTAAAANRTEVAVTAAASATQASAAQTAAVANVTASALAKQAYSAAVPGPGCDTGAGHWRNPDPSAATITCGAGGMLLARPNSPSAANTLVSFDWPGHSFPSAYSVAAQVSQLGTGNCAVIYARMTRGTLTSYVFSVCRDGGAHIFKLTAVGDLVVLKNGAIPANNSFYQFTATVNRDSLSLSVFPGSTTLTVVDSDYSATDYVGLGVYTEYGDPPTALFSNFVYGPQT